MDQEKSFTADVRIAGINPYVDVPERVVKVLGNGTKAAVLVKVEGRNAKDSDAQKTKRLEKDAARLEAIGRLAPGDWFRTTLVPLRTDATRLYLDTWMRETAGVGVGGRVQVTIKSDWDSRELAMPTQLSEALNSHAKVKSAWGALAPSRRREILTYLNFLKTPAAFERNVQKVMAAV